MVTVSMQLSYRDTLGNENKKEREFRTFLPILTVTAAAEFNVM